MREEPQNEFVEENLISLLSVRIKYVGYTTRLFEGSSKSGNCQKKKNAKEKDK